MFQNAAIKHNNWREHVFQLTSGSPRVEAPGFILCLRELKVRVVKGTYSPQSVNLRQEETLFAFGLWQGAA